MVSPRKRPEAIYRAGVHIRDGHIEEKRNGHALIQKDDGKFVLIPQ